MYKFELEHYRYICYICKDENYIISELQKFKIRK
jgi:hypothetical protein